MVLSDLGRYSDAFACLENIPQEYPDINIYKGDVYVSMGLHDRAIEFFEKELAVNTNNSYAHELMGLSYVLMGDYQKALVCFDSSIGIQPDYWIYCNKGMVLANLNRYGEAIASYRKALAANPHDLDTRIYLARAISDSGRPEEAMPDFLAALDVDPNHPITLYGLALTLSRMKRYGGALVHADKAAELDPSNIDTMYLRAYILASLGRTDECLAALKRLAETDPKFGETVTSGKFGETFGPLLRDE